MLQKNTEEPADSMSHALGWRVPTLVTCFLHLALQPLVPNHSRIKCDFTHDATDGSPATAVCATVSAYVEQRVGVLLLQDRKSSHRSGSIPQSCHALPDCLRVILVRDDAESQAAELDALMPE